MQMLELPLPAPCQPDALKLSIKAEGYEPFWSDTIPAKTYRGSAPITVIWKGQLKARFYGAVLSHDRRTLQGATVSLPGCNLSQTSDEHGRFEFKTIPATCSEISKVRVDYQNVSLDAPIERGKYAEVTMPAAIAEIAQRTDDTFLSVRVKPGPFEAGLYEVRPYADAAHAVLWNASDRRALAPQGERHVDWSAVLQGKSLSVQKLERTAVRAMVEHALADMRKPEGVCALEDWLRSAGEPAANALSVVRERAKSEALVIAQQLEARGSDRPQAATCQRLFGLFDQWKRCAAPLDARRERNLRTYREMYCR